MSERPTFADAIHDGKRAFAPRRQIAQTICLVVFLISMKLFGNPETNQTLRIALVAATGLLAIASAIEWGNHERHSEEFSREVARDANGTAFRVTFYALWFLFMLDVAFRFPLTAQLPFGLPPLSLDWHVAPIIPLFVWAIAYILNLKWRRSS